MKKKDTTLPVRYLKPGEIFITEKPFLVKTVLGSCLTITIFSSRPRLSAICHAILNNAKTKEKCSGDSPACCSTILNGTSFKYVNCSIVHMIKEFKKHHINPESTEIKLFGGASVIGQNGKESMAVSVGENNIQTAFQILNKEGLTVTSSDTGGSVGRKLLFYTHTGEVYLKKLNREMEQSR